MDAEGNMDACGFGVNHGSSVHKSGWGGVYNWGWGVVEERGWGVVDERSIMEEGGMMDEGSSYCGKGFRY